MVDRAALIADAYALAKAGTGSWEAVVDLLKSYEGEINFTVWSALSSILRGLKTAMREVCVMARNKKKRRTVLFRSGCGCSPAPPLPPTHTASSSAFSKACVRRG